MNPRPLLADWRSPPRSARIIAAMSLPLPPPVVVTSDDHLRRLIPILQNSPRLAVDTESNSLHAYRERVCGCGSFRSSSVLRVAHVGRSRAR